MPERKEKMYLDETIYKPDNLNEKDRYVTDELERGRTEILGDDILDEYLDEKFGGASLTAQLIREQLEPFIDFLKKKWDWFICDKIIDSIDGYSEEEFEAITSKNKTNNTERKEQVQ